MKDIQVDDEVYRYLQKHAIPLEEKPNDVLRRLLLNKSEFRSKGIAIAADISKPYKYPAGTPNLLKQILDVILFMKNEGLSRTDATKKVASKYSIHYQTVIDKYCRQLGKKAYEIDMLLQDENLYEFHRLLLSKYNDRQNELNVIKKVFEIIKSN